jgi:hypothetical protein
MEAPVEDSFAAGRAAIFLFLNKGHEMDTAPTRQGGD